MKLPAPVSSLSSSTRWTGLPLPKRAYFDSAFTVSGLPNYETSTRPDAVDEVAQLAVFVFLDQAVDVGLEAGETAG